ncbi:hypothetical protein BMS3Abin07_00605 [bacterium BMS3Abin07]|nr:hypothetical protein BMS3Abin07_00605 [bacterium BMS3Abin07]GBE31272.1 hypothetical protein BMS3Bbin05_00171 [bacterium BMS3Bbin05]
MKYKVFIGFVLLETLVVISLFMHSMVSLRNSMPEIKKKKDIVNELMLTDLSIWTEARYTRNPSQADWFAPFQDYPSSIEHFPAGSIIAPGNIRGPAKSGSDRSTTNLHKEE